VPAQVLGSPKLVEERLPQLLAAINSWHLQIDAAALVAAQPRLLTADPADTRDRLISE